MNTVLPTAQRDFCGKHGVPSLVHIQPIRAGRNSDVQRLVSDSGQWILKVYFQHLTDRRNRLGTEFQFLSFCHLNGITNVPTPLGMDLSAQCALYTLLPGARPTSLGTAHISQAVRFIAAINGLRELPDAIALPLASDACLSWEAHLELTASRIARLVAVVPAAPIEQAAKTFVCETLVPLWQAMDAEVRSQWVPAQLEVKLPRAERILSPSDFGFHNTIEHEGELSFVDFEYAGWDDPAKLICDFICQPELPVNAAQGAQFREEILSELDDDGRIAERVSRLLPFHRIKWCCILLNEFRVEDRERRLHAGVDGTALLEKQLAKARNYFQTHFATSE